MVADSTKVCEWGAERLVSGCYAICVRNKAGKGDDDARQWAKNSDSSVQLFARFIDQWEPCIGGLEKGDWSAAKWRQLDWKSWRVRGWLVSCTKF
jgi:hypothetical protein